MKKTLALIILGIIAATTTLAIRYSIENRPPPPTPEESARLQEQRRQQEEQFRQRLEKIKEGDDNALKEEVFIYIYGGTFRQSYKWGGAMLVENGIPRERVVRTLDEIIRESLPDEKGEREEDGFKIFVSLQMLRGVPGDDVLALYEEYATLTTEGTIMRIRLTGTHNRMKEEMQEAQKQEAPPAE